jgi:hypothetical protein
VDERVWKGARGGLKGVWMIDGLARLVEREHFAGGRSRVVEVPEACRGEDVGSRIGKRAP